MLFPPLSIPMCSVSQTACRTSFIPACLNRNAIRFSLILLSQLQRNLPGQVVDYVMHGAADGAAGCPDMSAAAEEGCYLCHIHIFIGTHADLVFHVFFFVDKNCAVHTGNVSELVDNAVQI